jgi:thiamine pyrophosphate-dependent acetolactate synthase large subunit-like protein
VLAFGASLAQLQTEGGRLFPRARVVQIDTHPTGMSQGRRTADLHLQADAKLAATALLDLVSRPVPDWRNTALKQRIATEPVDPQHFPANPGTVDPRAIVRELDAAIPKDWEIVCGSAHFTGFFMPHLRGRRPERIHVASDFGAIGQALPNAIGVAVARGDGKVVLIEGDGSLMMHLQELETIRRHGLRLLICVMNDGGYGAEAQKLRAQGLDPAEALHGRGNLAEIARAFGLRGETVTRSGQLAGLFGAHAAAGQSELWDLHIDERIPSPQYRRAHFKKAA